jgi:hypothetical protein
MAIHDISVVIRARRRGEPRTLPGDPGRPAAGGRAAGDPRRRRLPRPNADGRRRARGHGHPDIAPALQLWRRAQRGADAARHPVIVALSAHAFAPDDGWLARLAASCADDDAIACACGDRYGPRGEPTRWSRTRSWPAADRTGAMGTRQSRSSTITPTTRCGPTTDERAGRPRGKQRLGCGEQLIEWSAPRVGGQERVI